MHVCLCSTVSRRFVVMKWNCFDILCVFLLALPPLMFHHLQSVQHEGGQHFMTMSLSEVGKVTGAARSITTLPPNYSVARGSFQFHEVHACLCSVCHAL